MGAGPLISYRQFVPQCPWCRGDNQFWDFATTGHGATISLMAAQLTQAGKGKEGCEITMHECTCSTTGAILLHHHHRRRHPNETHRCDAGTIQNNISGHCLTHEATTHFGSLLPCSGATGSESDDEQQQQQWSFPASGSTGPIQLIQQKTLPPKPPLCLDASGPTSPPGSLPGRPADVPTGAQPLVRRHVIIAPA